METENDLVELRKQCVNVLFSCPRGRYLDTCPLRKVRMTGVAQQVIWLKTRNAEELRRILAHHAACPSQK